MERYGLNNMDEVYVKVKDLKNWELNNVAEYFEDKDIVSLLELLSAFEYELERQKPVENEWDEIDKEFAYECERAEERELQGV